MFDTYNRFCLFSSFIYDQYQTSGYLLRKFKNSNGWQRLWVVFTQNCLFFYKSYRDDCPLASLPLLGYIIGTPGADDQIRRDNVIKMQFKNHVYFFRGETHHSFEKYVSRDQLSITLGSISFSLGLKVDGRILVTFLQHAGSMAKSETIAETYQVITKTNLR